MRCFHYTRRPKAVSNERIVQIVQGARHQSRSGHQSPSAPIRDFRQPGDGSAYPHRSASDLIWAVVMGRILRVTSFLRLVWLVPGAGRIRPESCLWG
jgi:hypothetical protein